MSASPEQVERSFHKLPKIFARLTGRNGAVIEYEALVVPTSEFCVLPTVDAYGLGYPEVAVSDARIPTPNSRMFATYTGYGRGTPIRMARVDIGGISLKDVEFLAFDLQQTLGVDVLLGLSLLRNLSVHLDFAGGTIRLEREGDSP